MISVNTNAGAMLALQQLNQTNSELERVQTILNTGLKVSGAKDDGGTYAIAQRMRADVAGLGVVGNSLDRGISAVDVSLAAGEAISDLLVEMKAKALAASDASLDTASRTALNEDYVAMRDQIATIVNNAEFNGFNLIDGSTNEYVALANADGTNTFTVGAEDLSLSGTIVSITTTDQINTATNALAQVTAVENSLDALNASLARMGTAGKSLDILSDFITKLSDETEEGIGNLVDADLARASADLEALQVKQQLGVQALSIANQAPQAILGFFQ